MGRLIDADKLQDYFWDNRSKLFQSKDCRIAIDDAPTVEAIPTPEVRKMLRDCADEVSDKILDIVKKEYISKAEVKKFLEEGTKNVRGNRATELLEHISALFTNEDVIAMLTELQAEILEMKSYESPDGQDLVMLADIGILFQEKINSLKEGTDGKEDS